MLDPLFDPGVKETVASALPATAETDAGGDGTVNGVDETTFDAVDVPILFSAMTSKSYDWPFVSDATVEDVSEAVVVA
jgi:hypothetical protein